MNLNIPNNFIDISFRKIASNRILNSLNLTSVNPVLTHNRYPEQWFSINWINRRNSNRKNVLFWPVFYQDLSHLLWSKIDVNTCQSRQGCSIHDIGMPFNGTGPKLLSVTPNSKVVRWRVYEIRHQIEATKYCMVRLVSNLSDAQNGTIS